jgi:Sodium:sulfate symporter transmembrane region
MHMQTRPIRVAIAGVAIVLMAFCRRACAQVRHPLSVREPVVANPGTSRCFLDVSIRGGVPPSLMAFGLLFASSYFSVITPQGGSQNIIFAASGYLTQRELYRPGFFTTLAFLAVFLLIGTPWVLFVAG